MVVAAPPRTPAQISPHTFALWTIQDVARFAQCSARHVANLRAAGLPFVRIGHMVRFHPPLVIGWLMSHASIEAANCKSQSGGAAS